MKLETLEDLLNSDVVYGDQPIINYAIGTASYPPLVNFHDQKTQKEDCSDVRKCVERMITKRDIATFCSQWFANYVAREMGTVDVGKIICYFDENLISYSRTVLFKKGHPLLDGFNILMRHYLEAGLMERLWTEMQHRAVLRGGERLREAAGDEYFPFSVSHLMPAFVVLLVGTVLSSVVLIGELTGNCLCKRRDKKTNR
jgi:hypothetical protein